MIVITDTLTIHVIFAYLALLLVFQHLIERSWYAVTETCLAFTVFRDDFSPKFVALFTLLLFLKCFHWLAEDRVDYVSITKKIVLPFFLRLPIKFILASRDFCRLLITVANSLDPDQD